MSDGPRIFCFINSGKGTDWVVSMAMAEDGTVVGGHASSNDDFARIDIGFSEPPRGPGFNKREKFEAHYPQGYDLEWVDDPLEHDGLAAAYRLNQAQKSKAISLGQGVVE